MKTTISYLQILFQFKYQGAGNKWKVQPQGKETKKQRGAEETIGTRCCQRQEKYQENKGGSNFTLIINNATERVTYG